MQHNVHDIVVTQMSRSLRALRGLLVKATEFAKERKFDENNFVTMRLAPDMFPFSRQVQIACDSAKFAATRLSGKTAPSFPDEEKTMAELIERVDKTVAVLQAFSPEDFQDYASKVITFQFRPGVQLGGEDYLSSHVLPNFYFHLSMVYAMLREHGVVIGKGDFLGEQNWQKVP